MNKNLFKSYSETLKDLCLSTGVSGNENLTGISGVVLKKIKEINKKSFQDKHGNIIAVFGTGKKKILFDAHIDEIGFISAKSNGREIPLFSIGDVNFDKINNSKAFTFKNNIRGTINIKNNTLFFESNKAEESSSISAGELVVLERHFSINSDDVIKASALDNRVGCSALLELMKDVKIPSDLSVILVFSTEEEKGCSTVGIVAEKYKPDFSVVVDAAYAKPINMDENKTTIPELGNGCAIQYTGKDFVINNEITQRLEKLASENNIKYQAEIPYPDSGRTNAPQLQKAGIRTSVINIPVRYQHTSKSEFRLFDAIEAISLLKAIILNYKDFVK